MRFRKRPVEVDAWPVRDLNYAAGRAWSSLPSSVRADYENPVGKGGWVFGALVAERSPSCVEQWAECEDGAYHPSCCRFPKVCSCNYEVRGIYVPTLHGSAFAGPNDWIVRGPSGDFWPVEASIFAETYERIEAPWLPSPEELARYREEG